MYREWNKNDTSLRFPVVLSQELYPLLLGVLFALLFTKIVFGDYDKGYQWTRSDLLFLLIVGAEGALGAWISSFLRQNS